MGEIGRLGLIHTNYQYNVQNTQLLGTQCLAQGNLMHCDVLHGLWLFSR